MQVVITESLDKAIKDYIDFKDKPESQEFNSFFVVVIRLLCLIYDELDILNPYLNADDKEFNDNLAKYGFEMDRILDFKVQVDNAYSLELQNKNNIYFINIQKVLIDMLIYRKKSIGLDEQKLSAFYHLLYTSNSQNPYQIAYNFKNAHNLDEIDKYYQEQMAKHPDVIAKKPKVYLDPEAYKLSGVDNFNELNTAQLDVVNESIYNHFGIKENTINRDYLLDQAIKDEEKKNNKITTGNGYVDILLIMSIICTLIMTITVITMIFV